MIAVFPLPSQLSEAGYSQALLEQLLNQARKAGADDADGFLRSANSLSMNHRLGQPELIERAERHQVGLRVWCGQRTASVASTHLSNEALHTLIEQALSIAAEVPENPHCTLAGPELLASPRELDTYDGVEPSSNILGDLAAQMEAAALDIPGITNSEGATAEWQKTRFTLATSRGFMGSRQNSRWTLVMVAVAGSGTNMERGYEFASEVYHDDLPAAPEVGTRAAERAIRQLGARRVKSARIPVIYEPRVACSLVGHLAKAVNGQAIANKTSFLNSQLGKSIFASSVQVIDDPLRARGLKSRAFDDEGLATNKLTIIKNGCLEQWLLDLSTASRLRQVSTGHAQRQGQTVAPAPTNLALSAVGSRSRAELYSEITQGFLVTELIGSGVNPITGDYSRGAAGFWIENGQIAYPVHEVTLSGQLTEMFAGLEAADDFQWHSSTGAPSVRIANMSLAGQ